jgi:hypothetical protein
MDDAVKELIEKAEAYLDARGVDWEDCDDRECPCQKTKDLTGKLRAAIKKVREEMAKPRTPDGTPIDTFGRNRIIRPRMVVGGKLGGK